MGSIGYHRYADFLSCATDLLYFYLHMFGVDTGQNGSPCGPLVGKCDNKAKCGKVPFRAK